MGNFPFEKKQYIWDNKVMWRGQCEWNIVEMSCDGGGIKGHRQSYGELQIWGYNAELIKFPWGHCNPLSEWMTAVWWSGV